MHGGVKFYRGSAGAARSYVEADRSRVDDYYLAEGTGLAERYVATPTSEGVRPGGYGQEGVVRAAGMMDGPAYERWVAGYDVETGQAKGRLRQDAQGLRFVEVVVNGPKTWSLVAAVHPEIAAAYDQAQDRAAGEIIGWLAAARHHPGRAAGAAGPGPGGEARGRGGAALHVAGPGTRTATSTCRSTPGSSPPADGGGCTRSASWTASRRSTGSVTPRSCVTPSSVGCSPRTGTRSTPPPARSPSSRRTPGRSAPAPRRSPATSTATRPSGAASTPARSPGRRCGGPGTVVRGHRPDPTRSHP